MKPAKTSSTLPERKSKHTLAKIVLVSSAGVLAAVIGGTIISFVVGLVVKVAILTVILLAIVGLVQLLRR